MNKRFTYRIFPLQGQCALVTDVLHRFADMFGETGTPQVIQSDLDLDVSDIDGHRIERHDNEEQRKCMARELVAMYGGNLKRLHAMGFTEVTAADLVH